MTKMAARFCVLIPLLGCASTVECPEAAAPARSEHMQVVPLQHAAAAELAAELRTLLREARVVADQRTNSLLISAETEAVLAQVLELVADLDVESAAR